AGPAAVTAGSGLRPRPPRAGRKRPRPNPGGPRAARWNGTGTLTTGARALSGSGRVIVARTAGSGRGRFTCRWPYLRHRPEGSLRVRQRPERRLRADEPGPDGRPRVTGPPGGTGRPRAPAR